jgi:hypothetical protein
MLPLTGYCIAPGGIVDSFCIGHVGPVFARARKIRFPVYTGDLLHTIAISRLSRVRTEVFDLAVWALSLSPVLSINPP